MCRNVLSWKLIQDVRTYRCVLSKVKRWKASIEHWRDVERSTILREPVRERTVRAPIFGQKNSQPLLNASRRHRHAGNWSRWLVNSISMFHDFPLSIHYLNKSIRRNSRVTLRRQWAPALKRLPYMHSPCAWTDRAAHTRPTNAFIRCSNTRMKFHFFLERKGSVTTL